MNLCDYINKYNLDPVKFAVQCGLSHGTIYGYIRGIRTPLQRTAELIERMTNREVTVYELRGKDDRLKP